MDSERILLLHTSEDVIEALAEFLRAERYEVTSARVGDLLCGRVDGAALLGAVLPHLVILDVPPPVDAHWESCARFQSLCVERGVPVLLTATLAPVVRELADREVLDLFADPHVLLHLVAVAVGRRFDPPLATRWFPAPQRLPAS